MHRLQLQIAVALLIIEAGVFAYLSDTWTMPLTAALVGLLSLSNNWRLPLHESQRFVGSLALAVPFTLQWAFTPYEPAHIRVFILYPLAHAGGQYGLALQASYLWVKQPREPWSASYPLCGVCVLMAASDVQTTAWQSHIFQAVVLAFTVLAAAYFSAARVRLESVSKQRSTSRLWISLATMGLIFIVAIGSSLWLERSWSTLERLYTQWMWRGNSNGEAGFSRHARLGSISDRPSSRNQLPMLRIYAQSEPGYLRGAAFDHYRNGSWLNDSPRNVSQPTRQLPTGLTIPPDQMAFQLPGRGVAPAAVAKSPDESPDWHPLEVWPAASLRDALFAPIETEWLALAQPELLVDAYGIVYPDDMLPESSYTLFSSQPAEDLETSATRPLTTSIPALQKSETTLLTSLPDDLDPRIRELADEIFANSPTPELKVIAAAQWFRKNYHYELGVKIPAGQDPMTYFLLRRPAAHCEYFATGTVILLRLTGVPCRYVTGFVSTEYNYFGGYWLARNKDAHAWVEAWLPGQGWVTVESTPSSGVPHSSGAIQPNHLWDDLLLRVQMLRSQLTAGTLRGFLRACRTIAALFFTTPHGWLMLSGLLVWGVILWRRHVKFTVRQKYDPISAEFHQLLSELDRRLERLDFRRPAWETLTQFAHRLGQHPDPALQTAADWYRDYCEVRYQTDSIPLEIRSLKDKLPGLLVKLKQVAKPSD